MTRKVAPSLPRRRLLKMLAASTLLPALPFATGFKPAQALSFPPAHQWEGMLLGADCQLTLYHHDSALANGLLEQAVSEARRLEQVFSLYRDDSEISRLNAQGSLSTASADFVHLAQYARTLSAKTNGAFDLTVQPLWTYLRDHFRTLDTPPSPHALASVQQRVNWQNFDIDGQRLSFAQAGMALTLNGIAQGYITDRISDLFQQAGLKHVLVDMGEHRAIATRPDGSPWKIGLLNPARPYEMATVLPLQQQALATSGGYGLPFDRSGQWHHLLNPIKGRSADQFASVSVLAPTATQADGWSTAFSAMALDDIQMHLDREQDMAALITHHSGAQEWRKPRV